MERVKPLVVCSGSPVQIASQLFRLTDHKSFVVARYRPPTGYLTFKKTRKQKPWKVVEDRFRATLHSATDVGVDRDEFGHIDIGPKASGPPRYYEVKSTFDGFALNDKSYFIIRTSIIQCRRLFEAGAAGEAAYVVCNPKWYAPGPSGTSTTDRFPYWIIPIDHCLGEEKLLKICTTPKRAYKKKTRTTVPKPSRRRVKVVDYGPDNLYG